MTTDPNIQDQSYAYFLQEAPELLKVLEQELLNLQEDWSINKIHTLMRTTHTLKGAAASVGLESIKSVAHSLEDVFKALCKPDTVRDPEIEALLFEAYDCLRIPLMAEITSSQTDHSEVFDRAAAIFSQLQEKLGDCFGEEAYIPTSEELGFDMTHSIFEVGVTQRLEQMAAAIADGDPQAVAANVQTQAEVFLGLAQSLNLPGFGAIAQATIAALAKHPDQALMITEAALVDFHQGQADVLGGDRTSGGRVSPELQELADLEAEPIELADLETEPIEDPLDSELDSEAEASSPLLETIWNVPDPPPEETQTPNPPPKKEIVSPSPTVRIEVEQLDRLNYLVGELLTNQNRQSLQDEQLQSEIRAFLAGWQQHQRLLTQLKKWFGQHSQTSSLDGSSYLPPLTQMLKHAEQLGATVENIDWLHRQSSQVLEKQRLLFTSALDGLLEARMVPLGEIFGRLPPLLQQLETLHHKPVELRLGGTDILLDKAVAEKLYDPLLHLVRNAFDHGIEPPEQRHSSGKVRTGEIEIRAFHQGSHLTIEVRDDGQGINYDRVRQRAVEQDLVLLEEVSRLDEAQLLDLLFEPGFSTAEQVSNLSGRGIGLDVVRAQVEALQGAVTVYSEPSRGTTFLLQIPFSLTMAKLLLVQADSTTYAFLTDAVEQVLVPQPDQLRTWEGGKALRRGEGADERLICVYRLEQILTYLSPVTAPERSQPTLPSAFDLQVEPIVLLRCEDKLLGLEVDQIIGEQELVIRPSGAMIVPPPYIYGGSVLADGRLALVVDGVALAKQAFEKRGDRANSDLVSFNALLSLSAPPPRLAQSLGEPTMPAATILLVEDSLTQRQNLALTLEESGYQVLQAENGNEAIEKLQRPNVQLVICDLEMPRMNGFEFLSYCQQSQTLAEIPVIILTSKSEQRHRLMAMELGAASYLHKPCSKQQLLATVAGLLTQN